MVRLTNRQKDQIKRAVEQVINKDESTELVAAIYVWCLQEKFLNVQNE